MSTILNNRRLSFLILLITYGCYYAMAPEEVSNDHTTALLSLDESTFELNLDDFTVPETTKLAIDLSEGNSYTWDMFAWQTFIAMNWPAVQPSEANGYLRGFPDSTKTFLNAGDNTDQALVWETFKEKREMFKYGATTMETAKPDPWSAPYAFGKDKRIYATSKITTLDETVQVRAEAREPYYKVATGSSHYGLVSAARVFRGDSAYIDTTGSGPGNAVRYEVKVNYDFYKYVVDNELYFDPNTYARSKQRPPVQLPWRTSLPDPGVSFLTQKPAETSYVAGYRASKARAAYKAGAAVKGTTPPRVGAIHVKAAWAPIEESEKDRFLARKATYFNGTADNKTTSSAWFGLVGLHIIQRIKVQAPANLLNGQALGGTFIFSTWEHKDIRENPTQKKYWNGTDSIENNAYAYTNYFLPTGPKNVDPALSDPFIVNRIYPILDHTQKANEQFTALIAKADPTSVWANYRLVGTQYMPINIENLPNQNKDADVTAADSKGYGPYTPIEGRPSNSQDNDQLPLYLANLVIETSVGLQQFQGQPPLVSPVPQFAYVAGATPSNNSGVIGNTSLQYVRTAVASDSSNQFGNLYFGASPNNMGGCMGCHGVAQLNGYSFSFVLLAGQAGADPDSEIDFVDPYSSRNENKGTINPFQAPIDILLQGGTLYSLQNVSDNMYLENDNGTPKASSSAAYFKVVAADGRATNTSFNYGDAVNIIVDDPEGSKYLVATSTPVAGLNNAFETAFVSAAGRTPQQSANWYLFSSTDADATTRVLTLNGLGFKSETVGKSGTSSGRLKVQSDGSIIVIVDKANTSVQSSTLWMLKRKPFF